jgi:ElaB/YqjD/DUF883 family membrane-anchored ribosome-binding protein
MTRVTHFQSERHMEISNGESPSTTTAANRTESSTAEALRPDAVQALAGDAIADVQAFARGTLNDIAEAAADRVRTRPWQSLGVAAGVGLILGVALNRRQD